MALLKEPTMALRPARVAGGNVTQVERLVRTLSDDIVNRRLHPGARLEEQDLADRFGVSRTPVREALQLLVATGLLERRPHRGVVVVAVTPERLAQRFEVMAEMEAACARLAAERMTSRERQALEALHVGSAALVRGSDREAYEAMNVRFHAALYQGAHNAELEEMVQLARSRVAPYRRAQFNVLGRLASSYAEHEQVVRCILCGDGEGAARAMRGHVLTVSAASAEYVAERSAKDQSGREDDQ